ncbi:ABC transporter permease [Mesorhizobium sanjuanii]|uniref:ABC transporter permease n=1 Tax=Mesorhizobium sanjuanii TaxID=2037900 RepID=A0A2A6F7J7_9HYPH|nr:ABC transporter permease [Mesorhizobium sanjuanii]PDQ17930.1 ABC transporter permease [Mesorhizobium sanjuanii]
MKPRRIIEVGLPRLLAWCLLGFLFVPILVVIPVALTDRDYLSLPQDGVSMQHFAALADWSKGWLPSMLTSAGIALACAAIATALGVAFAVGAWAAGGWWPSLMRILLLSPMIVPPIIYAVGMVKLWARLSLLDSYTGVILVHVVLALPLTVLAIGASLSNLDQRLVQAARSLGARPMTVFGKVILPNIIPGVAAGALLAFVASWDEITVTLFITGRAVVTLPRRIWTSIQDAVDPALAAIATVLLVITVLALVARALIEHRQQMRKS